MIQENELDSELDFPIVCHTFHTLDFLNDIVEGGVISLQASTGVKVGVIDMGRSIEQPLPDIFNNAFTK